MRKTLLAAISATLCALAVPAVAQDAAEAQIECTVNFRGSDFMLQSLNEHAELFPGYFPLCQRLAERGYGVSVLDGHGSVGETKFGLVLIRLFDQQTGAEGARYTTNTVFGQDPAPEMEAFLLTRTIMLALESIAADMDPFVDSVDSENDRLAAFFGGGA